MTKQADELRIRIKPDGSVFVDEVTNGVVSTKRITMDNFLQSLSSSFIRENTKISSGILPKNCLACTCDIESESKFVVIELDYGKADITYMKTLYKDLPLPKMVFGFHVNKSGRIYSVKLGVTANERLTEDSQMYIYPFSNVLDFGLCTGANRMPNIKCLSQLSNLPWFIHGLPDNDDRYNERNNALRMGHRELLEHLIDKDSAYYYEKILLPMEGKTLKHFIESD